MVSLYVKIEWNNTIRIVRVLQCWNSRIYIKWVHWRGGEMERERKRKEECGAVQKREIASKNVNVSDRPIDLPTDQSTKIWNRASLNERFRCNIIMVTANLKIKNSDCTFGYTMVWSKCSNSIQNHKFALPPPSPARIFPFIHPFTYFSLTPSISISFSFSALLFFRCEMPISTTHF